MAKVSLTDACCAGILACLSSPAVPVYVVCHHGNDSQLAVQLLKEQLPGAIAASGGDGGDVEVKDIAGGLAEWAEAVDCSFPKY